MTITITVTKTNKLSVGKRNKDNVKRVRTYLISEERHRCRGASCVFEVAPPVIVEIASVARAMYNVLCFLCLFVCKHIFNPPSLPIINELFSILQKKRGKYSFERNSHSFYAFLNPNINSSAAAKAQPEILFFGTYSKRGRCAITFWRQKMQYMFFRRFYKKNCFCTNEDDDDDK